MSHLVSTRHAASTKTLIAAILVAWFLAALAGSLLGVFAGETRPPMALGLAVVVPVALFVIAFGELPGFRDFVSSLDVRLLTVAQTWRVGGIVFLILYERGLLPGVFAFPAGLGDIAIGLTAPLVARYWTRPSKVFTVWNLLGLADLVVAVSLGILASATPVGILAGDVTTRLMGEFPLSMIPTFFVPLLMIMHLIALRRTN